MNQTNRLEIRGIRKTFGANVALADLDLTIGVGQTHALVGQNGSGKSTMVKILAGIHTPDRGTVAVNGAPLKLPARPNELREAGISFVHQALGLVGGKSVAENIAVGDFTVRGGIRIDWRQEYEKARDLLLHIGADIDPRAILSTLGPADQSKVAIARAIRTQAAGEGVLVLDEPSRALPPDALIEFHRTIRGLVERGTAVLLISHNLEEVMSVSDRVSVLRDGELVARDIDPNASSEQEIASLLLGHELVVSGKRASARAEAHEGEAVIEGLVIRGRAVEDFTLRAGEVVGLTGLAGDRWEELPYALAGAVAPDRGTMTVHGRTLALTKLTPKSAIDAHIALVPEKRLDEGLAAGVTVAENMALPWYRFREGKGPLNWGKIIKEIMQSMRSLDVRPLNAEANVGELSGGNQQKVLLGKWLMRSPAVLLLHEPTQAVDVGARDAILTAVRRVADEGAAVLYASAQPTDLVEVSDRIFAYRHGGFTHVAEHTQEAILDAVYAPANNETPEKDTP